MIEIKKAKLTSVGSMEIDYKETIEREGENLTFEVSKKCYHSPHSDLLTAFDECKIHLAFLSELFPEMDLAEQWNEHEGLKKLKVTGFVIGGEDEHEGVTLIGRKGLANNRVLNLVTPFTKWEDEHNGYMYALRLCLAIARCADEVKEYLQGKAAPKAQLEIEFNAPVPEMAS